MFDDTTYRAEMEAALNRFNEEMKKVRTGRAHADMLSSIKAEVYSQYSPLNQVANVTVADATILVLCKISPLLSAMMPLLVLIPQTMVVSFVCQFHRLLKSAAKKSSKLLAVK